MNTYLSAMRNTIITLTLGIGIFGFSKTFKNKKSELVMRTLSLVMYLYSLALCVNSNLMFRKYLESLSEEQIKEFPPYINLEYWRVYEVLGWIFSAILILLICLASKRFLKKLL